MFKTIIFFGNRLNTNSKNDSSLITDLRIALNRQKYTILRRAESDRSCVMFAIRRVYTG